LFCLRVYLFWSQELETISTFETANVLSPWSIFMPLLELLLELPLALLSEAGRLLPVELVVLPVLLADGAVLDALGEAPLVLVPVLALPLAPGVLSLIAPPLPLVEAVVELEVLLPAGAVVVVVVVVVGAEPLLAVVDPLIPELLLVAAPPFCQSPCSFTECPTWAERSCALEMLAILPFFSCSM
jgi:hypothetical protein